MAGKGSGKNRKSPKKCKLDVERFAYDILSFVLPICGFPEEQIQYNGGKQNVYRGNRYIHMVCAISMTIALNNRDKWKTMFESRLKSSGFDTFEKIEKYLTPFLAIEREFQKGNTQAKVLVSLGMYSEIMLFLNHKGIKFDFDQLFNLWSRHFMQYIAKTKNADELLNNLFSMYKDPSDYIEWVISFVKDVAIPYGSKDNVSRTFSDHSLKSFREQGEKDKELAEVMKLLAIQASAAEEAEPVLPAGFESPTVLPGDRDSPEPPLSPVKGAVGGKKKHRSGQTRSTSVCESKHAERRRSQSYS